MPKFPKAFGRRKLPVSEDIIDGSVPVVEHSFKVFERAEGAGKSFDSGRKFSRTPPVAAGRTNALHLEDDNLFENIRSNHSGASNTLTSATDNSSRLSATSTVPSSTDNTFAQEWTSPHDRPFTDIPLPPAPRTSSAFSLKSAGRAMSWGKSKASSNKELSPSPQNRSDDEGVGVKQRTVTSSSYASTAVPTKCDEKELDASLTGQFSDLFSTFEKKMSSLQDADMRKKQLKDYHIAHKASRQTQFPLDLPKTSAEDVNIDPWKSQKNSSEDLISGASPPVNSTQSQFAPRVPTKPSSSPSSSSVQKQQRSQQNGIRRVSISPERNHDNEAQRTSISELKQENENHMPPIDEDAQLLQESVLASRRINEQSLNAQGDWPSSQNSSNSRWTTEDLDPHDNTAERDLSDDNMFDSTIIARADLAQRYQERSVSPPRTRSSQTKVMTPAQFERYKQDQERLGKLRGSKPSDEVEDEEETYDDDDDDAVEKAKELAKQRRKQEAHMAVYRQQMMKVTGEAPGTTRPSILTSQSSPNLPNLASLGQADENEEEDEEVPLGILQAHGFPSKNKPPMRSTGSNPNLKASAGSVAVSGVVDPRLPVFARNLPHDPYYGSGIVKPMHRESMAFSGGSPANNACSMGLPPGGLVGVIATEERSRALRRGSPNPQVEFPIQMSPSGMNVVSNSQDTPRGLLSMIGSGSPLQNLSQNPRASMMLTPGDQAQIQMTQQMQQFMQMQMQFMQMMAQNGQQPTQLPPQLPSELIRPASAQIHQRPITMLNPNSSSLINRNSTFAPSVHGGNAYAPSIAPSERSNIGLPGRYRPVSQAPVNNENRSRASSMCGGLQSWGNKNTTRSSAMIKVVNNASSKSNDVSDEDEDEAWAKMTKKKNEKQSVWRNKKERDSNGLKEMLGYVN